MKSNLQVIEELKEALATVRELREVDAKKIMTLEKQIRVDQETIKDLEWKLLGARAGLKGSASPPQSSGSVLR
jgi:hypothetical protein